MPAVTTPSMEGRYGASTAVMDACPVHLNEDVPLIQAAGHSQVAPEQTARLSFLFRCFKPQQFLNPHLRASVSRLWLEPTAEAVAVSEGASVSARIQKGWPWRLVGQPSRRRASSSKPYSSLVLICFTKLWSRLYRQVCSSPLMLHQSLYTVSQYLSAFQLS